jgi:hypothetical protein
MLDVRYPPIWSTQPVIDSLLGQTQMQALCGFWRAMTCRRSRVANGQKAIRHPPKWLRGSPTGVALNGGAPLFNGTPKVPHRVSVPRGSGRAGRGVGVVPAGADRGTGDADPGTGLARARLAIAARIARVTFSLARSACAAARRPWPPARPPAPARPPGKARSAPAGAARPASLPRPAASSPACSASSRGLGIGATRVQRGTRSGAALPRRTLDVQPWQPLEPAREVPVPRPEELHRGR